MAASRILSFDLLKAFAIFLVVWGHVIQYFLSTDPQSEPVYRFIYAFHMPLFMMVSGYFSGTSLDRPVLPMLRKRFMQLIVPCVAWGVVLYVTQLEAIDPQRAIDYSLTSLLHCLTHWFWFLKSLFCCFVLLALGKWLRGGWAAWGLLLLLSQFLPFLQLRYLLVPFLAGVWLSRSGAGERHPARWCGGSALVFVVLFMSQPNEAVNVPSLTDSFKGGDYAMALELFGWRLHRIFTGLAGSMCCISFFRWANFRSGRLSEAFAGYGRQTLGLYVLQVLLVEIVMAPYFNMDGASFVVFNFVLAPGCSLLILGLLIDVVRLLASYAFTAKYLLGVTARKLEPSTSSSTSSSIR